MREIDARKAIKKLKSIQLELRKIQQSCMIMGFQDTNEIILGIQDMKEKLDKQCPNPVFV
jgi:hypothetical protein